MALDGKIPIVGPETPVQMAADTNLELAALFTRAPRLLASVAGVNTITAQSTPAITAYADGANFVLVTASVNTGAVTLNIDTVGAKDLKHASGTVFGNGELGANTAYIVTYVLADDEFRVGDASSSIKPTFQLITTTGTWTKPTGLSYAEITCVGHGGNGQYNAFNVKNGGAGGACAMITVAASVLGATEVVTVPASGANLDTSFGTHCIAEHGLGMVAGLDSNCTGDFLFSGSSGGQGVGGGSGFGYGQGQLNGLSNQPGNLYGGGGGGSNQSAGGSTSTTTTTGGKGVCIVKEFF